MEVFHDIGMIWDDQGFCKQKLYTKCYFTFTAIFSLKMATNEAGMPENISGIL